MILELNGKYFFVRSNSTTHTHTRKRIENLLSRLFSTPNLEMEQRLTHNIQSRQSEHSNAKHYYYTIAGIRVRNSKIDFNTSGT